METWNEHGLAHHAVTSHLPGCRPPFVVSCSCPAGYTASIVYCLITMLLFNTQQDLENPFDMNGMVSSVVLRCLKCQCAEPCPCSFWGGNQPADWPPDISGGVACGWCERTLTPAPWFAEAEL